jgi:CDP-glycerol glycerophosphotransferase (TagB/SpsB family)
VISTAIRLARVGSGSELAAAVLMVLGYPCLLLAALLPNLWFFAAAAAVTYVTDWYLHQRGAYLINRLIKVRAGLSIRFLVRQILLILLLARMHLSDDTLYYVAVAGFLVFYGLQVPQGVLTTMIRLRRTMPVVTRNVDLHAIRIPDAPPKILVQRPGEKMLHLDLPGLVGVLIGAQTGQYVFGYSGVAVTIGLALIYVLLLTPYLLHRRLVPRPPEILEAVDKWLREYQPTVVLYFSGSKESAYQVNMWLETMEQIEGRPLIILRERAIAAQLDPTSAPMICVPGGTHLMNLDLSSVRVALYVANVGKNIHLLRVPTMKHVFIGHGDSDKIASVNPYSKVYDEVWTAGRAGRDRYALADVGVRDDTIVEVGRPQLAPIEAGTGTIKNSIPTILYAPTWEGWDDNPGNTSLLLAAENIIRRLVDAPQPVRVIYKPHPFTGIRDPKALAVHERIMAKLNAATAARTAEPRWVEAAAERTAEQAAAHADLARIEAELVALTTPGRAAADEAEQSRVALADRHRLAQAARLRAEWNDAYWRSFGWWEHRVVVGVEPRLYDCFNQSDGMVSDISSVVSDFIASGKPYAVTDSAALGPEEFKRQNTAVRAAVILSNDAAELDQLLAAVADPKNDPLVDARRDLKRYLLGPDKPSSLEQFNAATVALAAKSEARNAVVAQRLAEPEAAAAPDDSASVAAGDEEVPEPEENEPAGPEKTGLDSPVRG